MGCLRKNICRHCDEYGDGDEYDDDRDDEYLELKMGRSQKKFAAQEPFCLKLFSTM